MYRSNNVVVFADSYAANGAEPVINNVDALAALEVTLQPEVQTERVTYACKANERASVVDILDQSGTLDVTTYLPVLGVDSDGSYADEMAIARWLLSCGAQLIIKDTGEFVFSNAGSVAVPLKVQARLSDGTDSEKTFTLKNLRNTCGLSLPANKRGKISFKGMGDFQESEDLAVMATAYGAQKSRIAPINKKEERAVFWRGIQFCPEDFETSDLFGYELERELLACSSGASLTSRAGDFSVTVLEAMANHPLNPERLIGKGGAFSYQLGVLMGYRVSISFEDAVLESYSSTTVGKYRGQQWKMFNRGMTSLTFS